MKREHISEAVGNISPAFIQEAADYIPAKKRGRAIPWKTVVLAAVMAALLVTPIAAYTVDTVRYNAAVDYLRARGVDVTDRSDYSREDIVAMAELAQTKEAYAEKVAELEDLRKELLNSPPPARPTKPTDVTSDQIRQLTPTMTLADTIGLLGDTEDIGSGICILLYRVDGKYTLTIPFAGSGNTQLGVTGEELLLMLEPIE